MTGAGDASATPSAATTATSSLAAAAASPDSAAVGTPPRVAPFAPKRAIVAIAALAVAVSLLIPPLGGRDEAPHFLRAYALSQGDVLAQQEPGAISTCTGESLDSGLGSSVPRGVAFDLAELLKDGVFADDHTEFLDHVGDRAPAGPECFVDYRSTAVYSPIPYVPAALAVAAARASGTSTLVMLWLARVAMAAACIALLRRALHHARSRAWLFALLAAMPVVTFQIGLVTADGVTIMLALLAIAMAIRLFEDGVWSRAFLVELSVVFGTLALAKPPAFLFVGLLLPAAWRHRTLRRQIITVGAGAIAIGLAWNLYANAVYLPLPIDGIDPSVTYAYNNVDAGAQLRGLATHPWRTVTIIARTVPLDGFATANEMVTMVPGYRSSWWIAAALYGSLALAALQTAPIPKTMRRVGLAVAAVAAVAVFVLAYAGWNAVGAPRIDAFQGRYLYPSLALLLVALARLALPERVLPERVLPERVLPERVLPERLLRWTRIVIVIAVVTTSVIILRGVQDEFYDGPGVYSSER